MIVGVDIDVLSSQVNSLREFMETYHEDMKKAADLSTYSGIEALTKFNNPLNEAVALLVADYDKAAASMLELVEQLRATITDFEAVDAQEATVLEQLTDDLDGIETAMSTSVDVIPASGGGSSVLSTYSIM